VLLTSEEPVVKQFLNGRMDGPIGMSEEKDSATMAAEQAMFDAGHHAGGVEDISGVPAQMQPTPGMPERQGARRRTDRVMRILHTLPQAAQDGIVSSMSPDEQRHYNVHVGSRPTPSPTPSPRPRPNGDRIEGRLDDESVARLPDSDRGRS